VSETLQPTNPSTGERLPPVPCTSREEVVLTVERCAKAQVAWGALDFEARAGAFEAIGSEFSNTENVERLATTICDEMGKPIKHARGEISIVANRMTAFVDRAREACRDQAAREGAVDVTVQWRPLGVVGVIAPWNYPISTPNSLVVSALLTGNAAVLKPSEFTPRTGAIYHELVSKHLPDGVFELIQGAGDVGAALVDSDVSMIAFTGSIATGQAIMREAANTMKRLVLEMGGKDPMIVLPGADLDAAAAHAARESLRNTGQVCISVERILVHQDIAEEFTKKVKDVVSSLVVGDPHDEATDIGPMVSAHQRELVEKQLEEAQKGGARFVVRGSAKGPGFFLSPSVVADVSDDLGLARDETFGPVVAISTFDQLDDAVRRANDTRYGLGASVWGPEGEALDEAANRLEAGMVGVNRGLSAAAGAPWVGWKMSGFGYSRSIDGMRQFMIPRSQTRRAK
jgi:aldehyde dehydrogenase (NAD+)/succinate-semialdehyde dehydrogenase/glutarate-semialdehyde dehydrogenase